MKRIFVEDGLLFLIAVFIFAVGALVAAGSDRYLQSVDFLYALANIISIILCMISAIMIIVITTVIIPRDVADHLKARKARKAMEAEEQDLKEI